MNFPYLWVLKITIFLLEQKVISRCQKCRARPACISVYLNSILMIMDSYKNGRWSIFRKFSTEVKGYVRRRLFYFSHIVDLIWYSGLDLNNSEAMLQPTKYLSCKPCTLGLWFCNNVLHVFTFLKWMGKKWKVCNTSNNYVVVFGFI